MVSQANHQRFIGNLCDADQPPNSLDTSKKLLYISHIAYIESYAPSHCLGIARWGLFTVPNSLFETIKRAMAGDDVNDNPNKCHWFVSQSARTPGKGMVCHWSHQNRPWPHVATVVEVVECWCKPMLKFWSTKLLCDNFDVHVTMCTAWLLCCRGTSIVFCKCSYIVHICVSMSSVWGHSKHISEVANSCTSQNNTEKSMSKIFIIHLLLQGTSCRHYSEYSWRIRCSQYSKLLSLKITLQNFFLLSELW